MLRRFSEAGRAGFYLLVTFGVLAAVTLTIDLFGKPLILQAYAQRFSFLPGQYFGEKVRSVRDDPANTCIIIGDSKAREGFDPSLLEQVSGTRIVNAGTTGGNNEVIEIQTAIMRRFDVRPKCIVVAISRWMMFRNGSPDLIGEEYIGLLGWSEVARLAAHPFLSKAGPRLVFSLTMPLRAQARQLNRILRVALFDLRARTLGTLPKQSIELYENELTSVGDFKYDGIAPILKTHRDKLIDQTKPWYNPRRYGGRQQELSLRYALDEMLRLSDRVVLVDMPSTMVLDPASRLGEPYLKRVLGDYVGQLELIDCSALRNEDLFVDEGHLTSEGRRIFTEEVGNLLRSRTSIGQLTAHCRVGPLEPII